VIPDSAAHHMSRRRYGDAEKRSLTRWSQSLGVARIDGTEMPVSFEVLGPTGRWPSGAGPVQATVLFAPRTPRRCGLGQRQPVKDKNYRPGPKGEACGPVRPPDSG